MAFGQGLLRGVKQPSQGVATHLIYDAWRKFLFLQQYTTRSGLLIAQTLDIVNFIRKTKRPRLQSWPLRPKRLPDRGGFTTVS